MTFLPKAGFELTSEAPASDSESRVTVVDHTTVPVSVPAGSDPAGRISCPLSVRRMSINLKQREKFVVCKSFIVLPNCFCFLMVAKPTVARENCR